jgi:hypothetical protein
MCIFLEPALRAKQPNVAQTVYSQAKHRMVVLAERGVVPACAKLTSIVALLTPFHLTTRRRAAGRYCCPTNLTCGDNFWYYP